MLKTFQKSSISFEIPEHFNPPKSQHFALFARLAAAIFSQARLQQRYSSSSSSSGGKKSIISLASQCSETHISIRRRLTRSLSHSLSHSLSLLSHSKTPLSFSLSPTLPYIFAIQYSSRGCVLQSQPLSRLSSEPSATPFCPTSSVLGHLLDGLATYGRILQSERRGPSPTPRPGWRPTECREFFAVAAARLVARLHLPRRAREHSRRTAAAATAAQPVVVPPRVCTHARCSRSHAEAHPVGCCCSTRRRRTVCFRKYAGAQREQLCERRDSVQS